jgi:uncharacterized membrane protein YgdD (TMEM256/DUF423 family)
VWLAWAGALGFLAVAAGAFGAHALKERLDPSALAAYDVAVRYQMYHAVALIGLAVFQCLVPGNGWKAVGWCWLSGTILFSGSIYGLTLMQWRWLGPVTPIGGVLLLIGWFILTVTAIRSTARG